MPYLQRAEVVFEIRRYQGSPDFSLFRRVSRRRCQCQSLKQLLISSLLVRLGIEKAAWRMVKQAMCVAVSPFLRPFKERVVVPTRMPIPESRTALRAVEVGHCKIERRIRMAHDDLPQKLQTVESVVTLEVRQLALIVDDEVEELGDEVDAVVLVKGGDHVVRCCR